MVAIVVAVVIVLIIVEIAVVVLEVVISIVVKVVVATIIVVVPVVVAVSVVVVLVWVALYCSCECKGKVAWHAGDGGGEIKLLWFCTVTVRKVEVASVTPITRTFTWEQGGWISVFLEVWDKLVPLYVLRE